MKTYIIFAANAPFLVASGFSGTTPPLENVNQRNAAIINNPPDVTNTITKQ